MPLQILAAHSETRIRNGIVDPFLVFNFWPNASFVKLSRDLFTDMHVPYYSRNGLGKSYTLSTTKDKGSQRVPSQTPIFHCKTLLG